MVPLVEKLINGVLERTSADRQMIGQFLAHLVSQHILLKKQYESALGRVLDTVEDLIVDIPKYWLYMGELIGQFKKCYFYLVHAGLLITFLWHSGDSYFDSVVWLQYKYRKSESYMYSVFESPNLSIEKQILLKSLN